MTNIAAISTARKFYHAQHKTLDDMEECWKERHKKRQSCKADLDFLYNILDVKPSDFYEKHWFVRWGCLSHLSVFKKLVENMATWMASVEQYTTDLKNNMLQDHDINVIECQLKVFELRLSVVEFEKQLQCEAHFDLAVMMSIFKNLRSLVATIQKFEALHHIAFGLPASEMNHASKNMDISQEAVENNPQDLGIDEQKKPVYLAWFRGMHRRLVKQNASASKSFLEYNKRKSVLKLDELMTYFGEDSENLADIPGSFDISNLRERIDERIDLARERIDMAEEDKINVLERQKQAVDDLRYGRIDEDQTGKDTKSTDEKGRLASKNVKKLIDKTQMIQIDYRHAEFWQYIHGLYKNKVYPALAKIPEQYRVRITLAALVLLSIAIGSIYILPYLSGQWHLGLQILDYTLIVELCLFVLWLNAIAIANIASILHGFFLPDWLVKFAGQLDEPLSFKPIISLGQTCMCWCADKYVQLSKRFKAWIGVGVIRVIFSVILPLSVYVLGLLCFASTIHVAQTAWHVALLLSFGLSATLVAIGLVLLHDDDMISILSWRPSWSSASYLEPKLAPKYNREASTIKRICASILLLVGASMILGLCFGWHYSSSIWTAGVVIMAEMLIYLGWLSAKHWSKHGKICIDPIIKVSQRIGQSILSFFSVISTIIDVVCAPSFWVMLITASAGFLMLPLVSFPAYGWLMHTAAGCLFTLGVVLLEVRPSSWLKETGSLHQEGRAKRAHRFNHPQEETKNIPDQTADFEKPVNPCSSRKQP